MCARTDIHVPQKWKLKQSGNKFLLGESPDGGRGRAKPPVYHTVQSLLYVKGTYMEKGAKRFFFAMCKARKLVPLNLLENIRFLCMCYLITGNRAKGRLAIM